MLVQFSNLLKIRLKRATFLRNGCAAERVPGASVCVTTAQVSYSTHHKTQSLWLNIFEWKNYGQYPLHTHWMSHNKVRQQRKHLNLACELYQHSHVVFYRTSSANYNVSQIKLDCLIHLRTLQKNSVILLENETTTIVMDVTILPHVYTRHSSPVLELWRHHYSQFASVMKSQGRWRNHKVD